MSIKELCLTIQHSEAASSTVQRTAHRFSGRYTVSVVEEAERTAVLLLGAIEEPERLEREFRAELLDDVLRTRIDTETAPLRRLIIEVALRSALREPDVVS